MAVVIGQRKGMDTAAIEGPELEHLVRQKLAGAGFTVEPSLIPADGGLGVWHEPGRGVLVRWGAPDEPPAEHRGRHDTLLTAVRLALRTILTDAGFVVEEECERPQLTVVSVRSADGGG
ncbi:hypothetical protein ACTMTF_04690 [Nonomuraea sp. ZG12]|uniref:hypothetical protein n=1 Tax=Nonomuraea sp. ZG12 TaxID=3452207 RepID=UPI003F8A0F63